MSSPQKLTKKQKKGIAFRDRKTSKSRSHGGTVADMEDNEVPVLEVQDLADEDIDTHALEVGATENAPRDQKQRASRKGKEKEPDRDAAQKKRKRDVAMDGEEGAAQLVEEGETEGPQRKKAKGSTGEATKQTKAQVNKQRYILFVGNLKYTTTAEAIKAHFAACDPPPTVRLRTPKPSASGKPTAKSKGCAFVEFSHRNALQQGLKLHQSELDGRQINVELTVGGGGKGEGRLEKLKTRNKGLFDQRKDRIEKLAKNDPSLSSIPDKPQRYSATSGLEQVQSKRRTWTVGDEEDGETHRGGKKHTKVRGRGKGKQWGTGVNAIPVG
ncbi:RRM domain-containing protein [Favolaschia claudopus]|uniref:RRM domain-containing protein n=1 Tax=Favolaschia claudopus TaxID=2862362 RepID=A0AAW0EI51_9AGAR